MPASTRAGQLLLLLSCCAVLPFVTADDFSYVPFPAFQSCRGHVRHLTCLWTVIVTSGEAPQYSPDLESDLCDSIVNPTTGSKLHLAHVPVCLQHSGVVAAVMPADEEQEDEEGGRGYVAPGTFIAYAKNQKWKYRVVERSFVYGLRSYITEATERRGNTGNHIWQYGASHMHNPYTTVIQVVEKMDPDEPVRGKALFLAEANVLEIVADPSQSIGGRHREQIQQALQAVERLRVPVVLFGIGVDVGLGVADDDLLVNNESRMFLQELAKHQGSPAITVRGESTAKACELAGVQKCVALGCPSFTINHTPTLGHTLGDGLNKAKDALKNGRPLKVSFTMNCGSYEEEDSFFRALLKEAVKHHEAAIVVQAKNDVPAANRLVEEIGAPANTVKKFNVPEQWFEFLGTRDVVVGCRIHGTMAAVAGGTPGIVLPIDERVKELAEVMQIPHVAVDEVGGPDATLLQVVQKAADAFDATNFEDNRRRIYSTYRDILHELDLEIHPELEVLVGDQA